MEPKMCIFYVGVNYDHNDMSGNGHCLDNTDSEGKWILCSTTIADGRCSKKRKSPVL